MVYISHFVHGNGIGRWNTMHSSLSVEKGKYPPTKAGRITRLEEKLREMISDKVPTCTADENKDSVIMRETLGGIVPYIPEIAGMLIEYVEGILPMPERTAVATGVEQEVGAERGGVVDTVAERSVWWRGGAE